MHVYLDGSDISELSLWIDLSNIDGSEESQELIAEETHQDDQKTLSQRWVMTKTPSKDEKDEEIEQQLTCLLKLTFEICKIGSTNYTPKSGPKGVLILL